MSVRITGPPRRRDLPALDRRLLRRRAQQVLGALEEAASELSIALFDDPEMAELNRGYRGRSGPTDVLSFSLLEGPRLETGQRLLGDVAIGVRQAEQQARRARRPLDDQVARLLVHGVLHLLGFDHERSQEARRMRSEERRLCRLLDA
ncbi:MAG: rRNA maturation RNase YbeY [Myxococcota bacterium]